MPRRPYYTPRRYRNTTDHTSAILYVALIAITVIGIVLLTNRPNATSSVPESSTAEPATTLTPVPATREGLTTTEATFLLIVLGVVLLWFLIPSWLCAAFTRERGHGVAIGIVLGLLFGWIAVLFCALMPYKQYGRGFDPGDEQGYPPRNRYRRRRYYR